MMEDKEITLKIEELEIGALGKLIYNKSMNDELEERDKLLNTFIGKITKDFQDYNYDFTVKIQYNPITRDQNRRTTVPKLLIHTKVESANDVSRTFVILREYFQILGNLRLPSEPYYKDGMDEKGNPKLSYFPKNSNDLTLLLDFTEYKCNDVYKESMKPLNKIKG